MQLLTVYFFHTPTATYDVTFNTLILYSQISARCCHAQLYVRQTKWNLIFFKLNTNEKQQKILFSTNQIKCTKYIQISRIAFSYKNAILCDFWQNFWQYHWLLFCLTFHWLYANVFRFGRVSNLFLLLKTELKI